MYCAVRARFAFNLRRVLEEKDMSSAALGRAIRPEAKNPTSVAAGYVNGTTYPGDDIRDQIAEALGVSMTALHAGNIDDFRDAGEGEARKEKIRESVERVTGHGAAAPSPQPSPVEGEGEKARGDELHLYVMNRVQTVYGELTVFEAAAFVRDLAGVLGRYE